VKTNVIVAIAGLALFFGLPTPYPLLAQEGEAKHHHYVVVDMGTFGGPNSFVYGPGESSGTLDALLLNQRGTATGAADTNVPELFCQTSECLAIHAFSWKNGVLTDLGSLPGNNNDSFPESINAKGDIAGWSFNGLDAGTGLPLLEAVLWKDGAITDLGTLGGNQSWANGINNRGEVVGGALNGTLDPFAGAWSSLFFFDTTQIHAFRWRNGVMKDLGTLGGPDSFAMFINQKGQIAGQSYTSSTPNAPINIFPCSSSSGVPTLDPFLWDGGKMHDLGSLGGTCGFPNYLNNRGQVVGQMNLAGDQTFHAFLWDQGSLQDLGTLGGDTSYASWISEDGEAVGRADLPGSQVHHAFLFKDHAMTDLGTPDGLACSTAESINSRHQVVGDSGVCFVGGNGFLWEKGGPVVTLQSLVVPGSDITQVLGASFINDRGEIFAGGMLGDGDEHDIVLIPCDEDHPDVEGCDYALVSGTGLTQAQRSVARQPASPVPDSGFSLDDHGLDSPHIELHRGNALRQSCVPPGGRCTRRGSCCAVPPYHDVCSGTGICTVL
jgi:probable HAF family extracellular repeat protein